MKHPICLLPLTLILLAASCVNTGETPPAEPEPQVHAVPSLATAPLGATPISDANNNGIDDSIDIAVGVSEDKNMNDVPDEVEDL